MPKPKIYAGICEFCGIPAKECVHHSGISYNEAPNGYQIVQLDRTKFVVGENIPKIIYSTWISDKPLPAKFNKYIESWKKVMPDYEIRLITIENCPHNPWIDKCLEEKKFVLASHYARVQRIYETGGIYFDIDVEAIKPFDVFLDDKMFVGIESENIINNAVYGAVKGHPFLAKCMELLDNFDINSPNVELETGIRMFAKLYNSQDWGDFVTAYAPEYFYPYAWDEEFTPDCITPKTHAIHHWAFSWNNCVSIIIPCYNQAQWLSDAVNSCLAQTVEPLEIIIVDDGSPDNTEEVAKSFKLSKVKYIKQKNAGVSAARNAGIKIAKGKYILTLDADDIIEPTFIQKTIDVDDVVSTQLRTFGDNERTWDPPRIHPEYQHFYYENQINCCSLFKREMWEKLGGYDEKMVLGYEDWDFWTRAAAEGYHFTVIMEPLFRYRKHGISMVNGSHAKSDEIRKYMINKYKIYKKKA